MTAPIFMPGQTWQCQWGRWWVVDSVDAIGAEMVLKGSGLRRTTLLQYGSPLLEQWVQIPPALAAKGRGAR